MGDRRLLVVVAEKFVRVEALPCLGTGKADLRRIREIAVRALVPSQAQGQV